jgi:hypothetical protein
MKYLTIMALTVMALLLGAALFDTQAQTQTQPPPAVGTQTQIADTGSLLVKGEVSNPFVLRPEDLAKMKRISIRVKDRDEKEHNFSGIAVAEILQKAGAPMGSQLRGKNMNKYLLVGSKDGYHTVFALAELDSGYTDRTILLVDQVDGQPLPPKQSPFRIIVPGEKKHARWTWGVTELFIGSAKE